MSNLPAFSEPLENFLNKKGTLEEYLIVDFWAPWCMPCRVLDPVVEELSNDYRGKIGFYQIDADVHPKIAREYEVLGIPTLAFLKADNGKYSVEELGRIVGVQPKHRIEEKIKEYFYS
ncbi:TPA: thiol reductase thioredoxin [Candidatus Woesearchaeota archaeon]|nr:Thioredoxin [archaeon GW2011_AR15]MBS3104050.1 thiol reductase thioredoxin [Candidatus Woesearchaeota archaeon]HIH41702.1 thiol reductase thioredoxin [Candidatus Woesearchaeota archaeon]